MGWLWFGGAVKKILGLLAPSAKKLAREGLDDFLRANIDAAFEILVSLVSEFPNLSLHELTPIIFSKLKERNKSVFDTWISRLIVDATEHFRTLQARGETPALKP